MHHNCSKVYIWNIMSVVLMDVYHMTYRDAFDDDFVINNVLAQ